MAHGRADSSAKPVLPNQRQHPAAFAFIQATERYLSGAAAERYWPNQLAQRQPTGDAPEVLDRWTIANYDRHSVALRKLAPGQRRQVGAFVALLFDGTTDQCATAARRALAGLGDPQTVAEMLFAPAARMIGEAWCADECNFVSVTMAVSRMQRMFRLMISETPPEHCGDALRSVLLAPAPGEQHAFGLSIVDDAFRRAGWDVDCCGGGEEAAMYRLAGANFYSVIGISLSTERLLPVLSSTIGRLRSKSLNKSIIVIAGGSLVIEKPQAAIDAGFDFVAITARSAVKLAESVLAARAGSDHASIAAE